MMITYRKARELLPVGDNEDFWVEWYMFWQAVVQSVLQTCLKTDKGYLDYDLHGYSWFLTEKGVVYTGNKADHQLASGQGGPC